MALWLGRALNSNQKTKPPATGGRPMRAVNAIDSTLGHAEGALRERSKGRAVSVCHQCGKRDLVTKSAFVATWPVAYSAFTVTEMHNTEHSNSTYRSSLLCSLMS